MTNRNGGLSAEISSCVSGPGPGAAFMGTLLGRTQRIGQTAQGVLSVCRDLGGLPRALNTAHHPAELRLQARLTRGKEKGSSNSAHV
jgi:hypothetical protein